MKGIIDLGAGQRGWMKPGRVLVAADGAIYAMRISLVYSDAERDEDWSSSGKDPACVPVGRTRGEGRLLVDPVFFKEFSRVETVKGLDAEPAELCPIGEGAFPHSDSDDAPFLVLCHGCGAPIMPGERIPGDRGDGYCDACWVADMRRRERGEEPRFFFPPTGRRRARTGAGSTGVVRTSGGGQGEGTLHREPIEGEPVAFDGRDRRVPAAKDPGEEDR